MCSGSFLWYFVKALLIIAALIIGAMAFDINVFAHLAMLHPQAASIIMPLQILIGVAGLYALVSLFFCGCCSTTAPRR